uniref:Intraflagellar transport protein 122 homolog n=1 Tax=Soboliphyme baturini TaxID=241478 RepID=A0A183IWB8_9BILA
LQLNFKIKWTNNNAYHRRYVCQAVLGHKATVFCLAYSSNGDRFASGSADKNVIIWNESHEGILRFNHNDSIQCLAFCSSEVMLLSCAVAEFGIWTLEQKTVRRHKTQARICCCTWSLDGRCFALGLFNGVISIRDKYGEEKRKIERTAISPVWSMSLNPNRENKQIDLAVADWSPALSFYNLSGDLVAEEKNLTFDPCCIDYFTLGEFIIMGGSNRKVSLYTQEGLSLGVIAELDSWVWACRTKPNTQFVDRYVYRENMTDVVVQHLLSDKTGPRIKCRDLVRKVAVYRNKLAVQLSDRVNIYELENAEMSPISYRHTETILANFECNLLVVCYSHILLCQALSFEKRLQCYNFKGIKEREWLLNSLIRYIKVVGGIAGREALIIGLKNGQIVEIFVDNPFPVELLKITGVVRCVDLSLHRRKVAVVDEKNICFVYDIKSKELLYEEPNVTSIAWNIQHEDILCFSGNDTLRVKSRDYKVYSQPMPGFVVGFSATQVFCLHMFVMSTIEVPLFHQVKEYISRKLFQEAYSVACLGIVESDWEYLAERALENLEFEIARKAFIRTMNYERVDMVESVKVLSS